MVTKEQKIKELDESIYKVREIHDMAFDYNQNDKFRTELSLKCADYLGGVWQTLGAIRDEITPEEEEKTMKGIKQSISECLIPIKPCPYLLPCGYCNKRNGEMCSQYGG